MKRTIFFFCFLACTVVSGYSQERAIKNLIEKSITFQNMNIVYKDAREKVIDRLVFNVNECSFVEDDLRKFMKKHPEYQIKFGNVEREYKWGYYEETIVSFSFSLNDPAANTLIVAIRLANNNKNLQMPSYHNFLESSDFFRRYVKNYSELSEIFKKQFFPEFTNYVKNNPEGMKQFCDKSPYSNKDLLKDINVWDLIQAGKRAQFPYVFLLEANKGYICDSRGFYEGSIRNGLAEGQGSFWNGSGKWVGTFSNGKRNGAFTNTKSVGSYGSYVGCRKGGFTFEFKGTCVNDQWEGEVVKTVSTQGVNSPHFPIYTGLCDVEKLYYSKGQLTRSVQTSEALTKFLQAEMAYRQILAEESAREARRRSEERQAAQKAEKAAKEYAKQEAANRKADVVFNKRYEIYFPSEMATEYHVTFGDGTRGSIGNVDGKSWYFNTRWDPSGSVGRPLTNWVYAGSTQQDAIEELYEELHR